jgi:hypothetical protein
MLFDSQFTHHMPPNKEFPASPILPFFHSPGHFLSSLTISAAILTEAPAGPSFSFRTL